MQLAELFRDREPEAAPGGAAGLVVTLHEALEERGAQLGRDAGAAVGDLDAHASVARGDGAANDARDRGDLEGVGEQVEDDALDLVDVELGGHRFGRIDRQRDPSLGGEPFEVARRLDDHLARVGSHVVDLELAGLELRDVEEVVHVLEERAPVAGDDLEVQAIGVGGGGGAEQALGGPEHQGERRAELVRDVGVELVPEARELGVLRVGLGELLEHLLELLAALMRDLRGAGERDRLGHEREEEHRGTDARDGGDGAEPAVEPVDGVPDGEDVEEVRTAAGDDEDAEREVHPGERQILDAPDDDVEGRRDRDVGAADEEVRDDLQPDHLRRPQVAVPMRHEAAGQEPLERFPHSHGVRSTASQVKLCRCGTSSRRHADEHGADLRVRVSLPAPVALQRQAESIERPSVHRGELRRTVPRHRDAERLAEVEDPDPEGLFATFFATFFADGVELGVSFGAEGAQDGLVGERSTEERGGG